MVIRWRVSLSLYQSTPVDWASWFVCGGGGGGVFFCVCVYVLCFLGGLGGGGADNNSLIKR